MPPLVRAIARGMSPAAAAARAASSQALGKLPSMDTAEGWALHVGVTKEQIVSILSQMMIYGGLAPAHNAMRVAKELFKEKGLL